MQHVGIGVLPNIKMNRRQLINALMGFPFFTQLGSACLPRPKIVKGEEWKLNSGPGQNLNEEDEELLKSAKANIPKIRMGRLKLKLVSNEKAASGTEFEIRQIGHEFNFGIMSLPNPDQLGFGIQERERVKRVFNNFTAKCYWNERWHQPIEKTEDQRIYSGFESEIEEAKQFGMKVKGHPLVWTVPKALPEWLKNYSNEKRLEILLNHVEDMVVKYKGKVEMWDVCNEFLWEPSLNHTEQRKWPHIETISEILTYLEPAMKRIRKADSQARLVLNDYGLEKDYRSEISARQQRERYVELVAEMKNRGIAPDAIGTQCHVAEPFSMRQIQTCLDHLASADLPLQITEFWAKTHSKESDANEKTLQYIQNAYTLGFGHPKMELFTYWGGDLFQKNGAPGSKFEVLEKLIAGEWATKVSFQTNEAGQFETKAFYGSYHILSSGKKVADFVFSKKKDGEEIVIRI